MWELQVRLASADGMLLASHRVTLSFQLRISGAGAELMMPAEVVGNTDASGLVALSLPSPDSLGETLRIVVRDATGVVVHEVERDRREIGSLLGLVVGGPARLVVELSRGGRPLADTELVVLGRSEGASSFTLVHAGKTDGRGRLEGPPPTGSFVEASVMVRADGNQTFPIALVAGRIPARVAVELGAVASPAPAPPPRTVPPPPSPAPTPVLEPTPGPDLPVVVSGALPSVTNPGDESVPDGERRLRRGSRGASSSRLGSPQVMLGLLAVVVIVGAFLRFYKLGEPSLWNDELSSWRRSSFDTLAKVITKGAEEDVHPPGYYILLHGVLAVGDSEWWLRLPSALAGVASLVVIFLLGRRLWSETEGLVAAGLMAVLWAPIRYSQEARSYALLMLFSMLAVWAWMVMMREVDRKGKPTLDQALWYTLAASALTYLHYFGVLLVGLQGIATAVYIGAKRHRQSALGHAAGVYVAIVVLYLPWIGPFLHDLTQSKSWMESPDAEGSSATWSYMRFLFNHQGWLTVWMLLLIGAAAGWALLQARGGRRIQASLRTRWLMVTLWLVVPYAIVWLQSVLATPVLSNRNLLISAPAAYLLVARAITALPIPGRLQAAVAALTLALSTGGFASKNYYSKPNRQQFREVVQYLVDHVDKAPDADIIVTGTPAHFNYYLRRLGAPKDADISANTDSDLDKVKRLFATDHPRNIWRLRVAGRGNQQDPVDAWLSERFQVADEAEFYLTSATLYQRDQAAAEAEAAADGSGEAAADNPEKPAKKARRADAAEDGDQQPKARNPKKKKNGKLADDSEKPAEEEDRSAKSPDTGT